MEYINVDELDTSNAQMVGVQGNDIIILMPKQKMTKPEALVLAAWLMTLADDNDDFGLIIQKVQS